MTMRGRLQIDRLTLGYRHRMILRDISVVIPDGQFTAIVGANGCGKSSLLRSMVNLVPPASGTISLDGRAVSTMRPRELARSIALLPQSPITPEGIIVRELVARGRFAWQSGYFRHNRADAEAIDEALCLTGMAGSSDVPVSELSGGQRQRAWISMILAQQTPILLLDEPTSFLDIAHQVELMELLVSLRSSGKTIVAVLHDINQACRYADHLIALGASGLSANGSPREVVDASFIHALFGLNCVVVPDPVTGSPMAIAEGKGRE